MAQAFLERFRIKATLAHLGCIKGNLSQTGFDRLRLITVSLIVTFRCPLVRCSSEILLAFSLHGSVDDNPDQFRKFVETAGSNLFQLLGWSGKIALVGHGVSHFLKSVASRSDTPDLPLMGGKYYRKEFTLTLFERHPARGQARSLLSQVYSVIDYISIHSET